MVLGGFSPSAAQIVVAVGADNTVVVTPVCAFSHGPSSMVSWPEGPPSSVFVAGSKVPVKVVVEPGAEVGALCTAGADDSIRVTGAGAGVYVDARGGDDEIVGSNHGDELNGGPGSDTIRGAGGDDQLDGGPGGDLVDGGPGQDACSLIPFGSSSDTMLACETHVKDLSG